jgi:hypothetical protein
MSNLLLHCTAGACFLITSFIITSQLDSHTAKRACVRCEIREGKNLTCEFFLHCRMISTGSRTTSQFLSTYLNRIRWDPSLLAPTYPLSLGTTDLHAEATS